MAGKIFINYRRSENLKDASHLATVLAGTFGKQVFIDIRGIDGFSVWLNVLKSQVASAAVMVSVIGPGWDDVRDDQGKRRLDDPNDFVRYEIAEALSRDIPVLPVVLDGASLPAREKLPEDIRPVLRRQAMTLRGDKFVDDAGEIAKAIKNILTERSTRVSLNVALMVSAAALIAGIFVGPYWLVVDEQDALKVRTTGTWVPDGYDADYTYAPAVIEPLKETFYPDCGTITPDKKNWIPRLPKANTTAGLVRKLNGIGLSVADGNGGAADVVAIEAGSAADNKGINVGDKIIEIGGRMVQNAQNLYLLTEALRANELKFGGHFLRKKASGQPANEIDIGYFCLDFQG